MEKKRLRVWHYMFPGFRGRLSLADYLEIRGVFYGLLVMLAFAYSIGRHALRYWYGEAGLVYIVYPILLFLIYSYVCLMALHVRRLHDVGRYGWWVVSPFFLLQMFFLDVDDEGEPGMNKWGKNPMDCGEGGASRAKEARLVKRLYRRAVASADAKAQFKIGMFYFTGRMGLPEDKGQAMRWMLMARDQGYEPALRFMDSLTEQNDDGRLIGIALQAARCGVWRRRGRAGQRGRGRCGRRFQAGC